MKKLASAIGAAALLSLAALSAPAQAQTGGSFIQAQVYVVPAPPPPPRHHYYAPPPPPHHYGGPRYYHRDHHHRRHWEHRHYGRRDYDRDGVPDRWDRRPANPYRY